MWRSGENGSSRAAQNRPAPDQVPEAFRRAAAAAARFIRAVAASLAAAAASAAARSAASFAKRKPRSRVVFSSSALRDFSVSLDTTLALKDRVGDERLLVTESGILVPADVAKMRANGVDAFLVGEAFMRAAEPGDALRELFGGGR